MVKRLLVLLLVLAGCSSPSPSPSSSEAPAMFTNPVFADNFPDPGVIAKDGTWYAYGTNNASASVPVMTSPDLVTWTPAGDAMPSLPAWVNPGNTWAPEVIDGDGGYLLYYTARDAKSDRQCIGVAFSASPSGPFVDDSDGPLICQADEGGSIDASPFRDASSGKLYLYWKNDGNAIQQPTYLYGQELSADGRTLTGEPVRLLENDAAWEDHVIEAPQMVRKDDRLVLFYSANAFDREVYAVGYATCETPLGPCTKAAENPILSTSEAAAGPGHSFLVTTPAGETWLLYHAWPPDAIGSVMPGRQLWLDRVDWVDGKPVVNGPTATSQPMPKS